MSEEERHFNRLTPAEDERLALLVEECAEVIQAAAKIQRHGYLSDNQGELDHSNRQALERELGHVMNALDMMLKRCDVRADCIGVHQVAKSESIAKWLHHQ